MTNKTIKNELKSPDFLQQQFQKTINFIIHHQSKFYGLLAILLLGIACIFGWYLYDSTYNRNALTLYYQADKVRIQNKNERDISATLDGYKGVIAKYPHSQAALYSHYMMGNLYLTMNQIDLSLKSYDAFLKSSTAKNNLYILALLGKSYCYEVMKQYPQSLTCLENALKSDTKSIFISLIYRDMGRIYEAINDKKRSLEYYQKSFDKTTDPTVKMIMKRKISELT